MDNEYGAILNTIRYVAISPDAKINPKYTIDPKYINPTNNKTFNMLGLYRGDYSSGYGKSRVHVGFNIGQIIVNDNNTFIGYLSDLELDPRDFSDNHNIEFFDILDKEIDEIGTLHFVQGTIIEESLAFTKIPMESFISRIKYDTKTTDEYDEYIPDYIKQDSDVFTGSWSFIDEIVNKNSNTSGDAILLLEPRY